MSVKLAIRIGRIGQYIYFFNFITFFMESMFLIRMRFRPIKSNPQNELFFHAPNTNEWMVHVLSTL
jgi:hypothetical protein